MFPDLQRVRVFVDQWELIIFMKSVLVNGQHKTIDWSVFHGLIAIMASSTEMYAFGWYIIVNCLWTR